MLLSNVLRVMQGEEGALPDEALETFMMHYDQKIGEAYFRTPRNTVTAFVNILSVLEQNPGADWRDLSDITDDGAAAPPSEDDDLANFKL